MALRSTEPIRSGAEMDAVERGSERAVRWGGSDADRKRGTAEAGASWSATARSEGPLLS